MEASCFTAVLHVPKSLCESAAVLFEYPADNLSSVPDVIEDWPVTDLQSASEYFDIGVNLGRIIYRELLESFGMILPQHRSPKLIKQLEPSSSEENAIHYHLVAEQGNVSGTEISNWLKRWASFLTRHMAPGHSWCTLWDIRKTRQGRLYQCDLTFLLRYLLPKVPVEHVWYAWTNMQRFEAAALSVPARVRCLSEGGAFALPFTGRSGEASGSRSAPTMAGNGTERFLNLIDWLVEDGIATERRWLATDKKSYRSFLGSSGAVLQPRNALQVARREMVLARPLLGYLRRGGSDIASDNKVTEHLRINGYDPEDAAWYFAAWAARAWAKRRAMWLWGPASTGKTLLAAAIAAVAPSYGCVNWTNQNLPFNDCHCQSLVWSEEGRMTEYIVEVAKAILGGAPVRLDVKNNGSEEFIPTCVIITSNGDLTVTVDRPVVSSPHQEALQTRITMFQFQRLVPPDLAPLPVRDLRDHLACGAQLLESKGGPAEQLRVPGRSDKPRLSEIIRSPHLPIAAEERSTWSSGDQWISPNREPRTTPEAPAADESTDVSVSELVSLPLPDLDAAESYQREIPLDVEAAWLDVFVDRAQNLNLRAARAPRAGSLYRYHQWLSEPWRYRQTLSRTEGYVGSRMYDWINW
uniref:Non-structural protein n=1 Tax=Porcine hokovirus TaxID=494652 RepID=I4CMB0_9VIRU|nr:non-structural protein [Porcine hokovirus]